MRWLSGHVCISEMERDVSISPSSSKGLHRFPAGFFPGSAHRAGQPLPRPALQAQLGPQVPRGILAATGRPAAREEQPTPQIPPLTLPIQPTPLEARAALAGAEATVLQAGRPAGMVPQAEEAATPTPTHPPIHPLQDPQRPTLLPETAEMAAQLEVAGTASTGNAGNGGAGGDASRDGLRHRRHNRQRLRLGNCRQRWQRGQRSRGDRR